MKKINILHICLFLLFVNLAAWGQSSQCKIVNKFSIPGEGGWDCLISDDATNRLFISHSTVVQVIDCSNGSVIATIGDMKGVHGIALAPEFNKGFITSGRDTSIVIFNLTTYEVISKLKATGKGPDIIFYDIFSKKIFSFNGGSNNATVIDASTNEIVSTIALDGKPEFAAADNKGKLFVNIEDKNEIAVIDTKTLTVEKNWSIAPGEEPTGLAFDVENNRLYSACGNKVMVVTNSETGMFVGTIPIGEGSDGAGFDTGLKRIYSSNGEGTLSIIQPEPKDKFKVLENFETQKSARTMAVNNKTHHIYLPAAEFEPVPEKTTENPNPRAKMKSGTFVILDIEVME